MLYIIYETAGDGDAREDIKSKGSHCRPLHPARIFREDILMITSLFGNMNYEATNKPFGNIYL
jgi:hypothetical protein